MKHDDLHYVKMGVAALVGSSHTCQNFHDQWRTLSMKGAFNDCRTVKDYAIAFCEGTLTLLKETK